MASADDGAGWMYDPDAIAEVDLGGLSAEEIEELNVNQDEYQRGTFELRVGGVPQGPPLDVGIRLKGGVGSFQPLPGKAAFKVKFNEFVKKQTFFGLEKLTLNNMVQDPSMLHEALTYELFRSLDLPASRTGYAFVRVNEEVYGLYLNVETLDEISLPRWFASTQHLFEADKAGVDVKPGGAEDFEVDEGKEDDIADLEALVAAANDGVGDWSDGMAGIADLEQMTRMWAVERYSGHWDGYAGVAGVFRPNNYYLHSDEAGLFTMLPWGTDQTWELPVEFDEAAGGRLFNGCLDDASCEALYESALEEVQAAVATLGLDTHAVELSEMLAPCQALEVEPRREYTDEEIEEGVAATRELIAQRPAELAAWLGSANPPVEGPPAAPPAGPCAPGSQQPGDDEEPGRSEQPTPPVTDGEPAPGRQANPLSGPPSLFPQGPVRIGSIRFRGSLVFTDVDAADAGTATKRVMAKVKGKWRVACTDQASPGRAGRVPMSCRLSRGVRGRLETAPLRLRILIDFKPGTGAPSSASRSLTAPRLSVR